VYRGDFGGALTALTESFIDPAGPFDRGVYMDFSAGAGDLPNPLALNPQSGENFGHPSLRTRAQLQPSGDPDQRFVDKLVRRAPRSAGTPTQLASDLGWIRYPSPNTPIPLIKNEELILLRAEANIGLGSLGAAVSDIDMIRTGSGHLALYSGSSDQVSLLTELLYNKRYSLLFEGGHSWVDYRRYDRLADLATHERGGEQPDILFTTLPIPTAEVLPRQ
jgi:starch-binding outer membrane protein, SusD/RagB family